MLSAADQAGPACVATVPAGKGPTCWLSATSTCETMSRKPPLIMPRASSPSFLRGLKHRDEGATPPVLSVGEQLRSAEQARCSMSCPQAWATGTGSLPSAVEVAGLGIRQPGRFKNRQGVSCRHATEQLVPRYGAAPHHTGPPGRQRAPRSRPSAAAARPAQRCAAPDATAPDADADRGTGPPTRHAQRVGWRGPRPPRSSS
jgi:hypothetical protein